MLRPSNPLYSDATKPPPTININSYLTKNNAALSRLLRDIVEKLREGDVDLMTRLRQIINTFINNSEISAQEVSLHLLGIPMSKSSVGEIFINTSIPEKRIQLLKSKTELEDLDPDSEDIFLSNVINRYIDRPDLLEKICLADFASLFVVSKRKFSSNSYCFEVDDGQFDDHEEDEDCKEDDNIMCEMFKNLPLKMVQDI